MVPPSDRSTQVSSHHRRCQEFFHRLFFIGPELSFCLRDFPLSSRRSSLALDPNEPMEGRKRLKQTVGRVKHL